MKEYTLSIVGHSADLKTSPTGSKDTGIFFPQDLIEFLGSNEKYSFRIYKEDCAKAMAAIISALPLYSNKGGNKITHSKIYDEANRLMSMITSYFGNNDVVIYSGFYLSQTTGGRRYLYGLEQKGFSIRKFLVADHSVLKFQKEDDGSITLRFQTKMVPNQYNSEEDFIPNPPEEEPEETKDNIYRQYITAAKSKPFLLLAGISGTGKSRIVRELARACWDKESDEYNAQKPRNFEMVQVKPNWHDSSELIGYVSRVSGEPIYVSGQFLKFIARAWEELDVPYFLCLDEMNLAPVEQYFAEYLSVLESRKSDGEGYVVTDPILEKSAEDWYRVLTRELTDDDDVRNRFLEEGICIPQNLIVVGTVNMDETTFSFSRKVLDRAMTIEMNTVDLQGGLNHKNEQIGVLSYEDLVGTSVEGVDIYDDNKEVCDTVVAYLQKVNKKLDKTPFKIAYRTRNEALLYVVNNLPYNSIPNDDEHVYTQDYVIARALDEITNMKILSRIEGDETKVTTQFLDELRDTIKKGLESICDLTFDSKQTETTEKSISLDKIDEMKGRLTSGYTSFWS